MARAIDEQVRIVGYQLSGTTDEWRLHLKMCRQCRPLTGTRNRYCTEGWIIVRTMRALRAQLATLTDPPAGEQLTLF